MKKSGSLLLILIFLVGFYFITKIIDIRLTHILQDNSKKISKNLNLNKNSAFEEIFNDLFNQSSDQLLIPKKTIFRTIKYMMEERDEYNSELVEFVRSLILQPPPKSKKLNLSFNTNTDFSQIGQSKYIDNLLLSKKNGFFVESGGFDGEAHSNSVFFELERNWTGILIEAIPTYYKQLLSKNRQIYALNACLASKKPLVAKFLESNFLSSRTSEIKKEHKTRISRESGNKTSYLYVPCFSLNTILKALDVNKIDYLSLDIEGGEFSALQGLDFKKIDIKSLSIEYNGFEDEKNKIQSHMEANGYKLTKDDKQDIYFFKN